MSFTNRIDIFNPIIPTSGIDLSGKIQLTTDYAAAPLSASLYKTSDTGFASPLITTTMTADANGDATLTMDLGSDLPTGTFVVRVTRTSGSPALTALVSNTITLGALGNLISYLLTAIPAFTALERFEELGMANAAYDTFQFGYSNWTSDSPILGEYNEFDTTPGADYKVDYSGGKFVYLTALLATNDVRASYKFDIFTYNDYSAFFYRTLAQVNAYKPQTHYVFDNMPPNWVDVLVLGAYIRLLESIALRLPTFKWKRVFEDTEMMLGIINSRLAEAKSEFTAQLAKTKRRGETLPLMISSFQSGGLAYQADNISWRNYLISR